MATPDSSRYTFDSRKPYAGVQMQMGRVTTDEDVNLAGEIQREDQRQTRVHVIGASGSPDDGFRVINPALTANGIDFQLLAGHFYLGGWLLTLHEPETFWLQRDRLQLLAGSHPVPTAERFDLVYLETYQQSVEAVEDSELFEVALGGPDTSARVCTIQRVHVAEDVGTANCRAAWQQLLDQWEASDRGTLNDEHELIPEAQVQVSFSDAGVTDDLCQPAIAGGYLGAENQAIRVQLVDDRHFTWGLDNASPLYRVLIGEDDRRSITLLTEPKDQAHWALAGQVVEVLPWGSVLPNNEKVAEVQGFLSTVSVSYNPNTRALTLSNAVPPNFGTAWTTRSDASELEIPSKSAPDQPGVYYYLRVWNRGSDRTSPPAIPFTPGTAVALGQTGVAVTFSGTDWLAGDYWVLALRPETPNQAVPWVLEEGSDRHGLRRFYTPLALIHWLPGGRRDLPPIVHDCRTKFPPLTRLRGCCTYQVGDGVHSFGDYNSIETALLNLPAEGGKICVLPGQHRANVLIDRSQNIQISGCGRYSVIHPHPDRATDPIFQIQASQHIQLDHLTLFTVTGTAVQVRDADDITVAEATMDLDIRDNAIVAYRHAIDIQVNNDLPNQNEIEIVNNTIGMVDRAGGQVAIFVLADDVLIERNRLVVVPPPDPDDPTDPRDPEIPDDVFDPCASPHIFYGGSFAINLFLDNTLLYITALSFGQAQANYLAQGGIQIGGSSDSIRILQNEIIGGQGNGIIIGHLPNSIASDVVNDLAYGYRAATPELRANLRDRFLSTCYAIEIEENVIRSMGLAGISVVTFFNPETIGLMVRVEDLIIYRNEIVQCLQQLPDDFPNGFAGEIGLGGITLAACINATIEENRIEQNGVTHLKPTCGIFILLGEKIDITNNRILNNGPRVSESSADARPGIRGGIVIGNSFQVPSLKLAAAGLLPVFDGIPGVKIHDNIVVHPFGQALFILAFGSVSIVGNQLTTQDADYRVNPFSLLAGSVFILNLGISKDLITAIAAISFASIQAPTKVQLYQAKTDTEVQRILGWLAQMAFLPNGRILFANNQTTLDLRSQDVNIAFSSQLITSLDDVSYSSNQSDCDTLVDILMTNVALFAVTIRTNDNRFQEGAILPLLTAITGTTLYSLISFGLSNVATGNQSTQCIWVLGLPDKTIEEHNIVLFETATCQRIRSRDR